MSAKPPLFVGARGPSNLSHRHVRASREERRSVMQQWLDLLLNRLDDFLALLLLFFCRACSEGLVYSCIGLGEPGIHEETDPRSEERRFGRFAGRGKEMGGEGVGQKLGDDAGVGNGGLDDIVVVVDGGDQTSLLTYQNGLSRDERLLRDLLTGLILRYHSSRGRPRSMMTSS